MLNSSLARTGPAAALSAVESSRLLELETTIATDAGPGCGHDLCAFERDCFVLQAAVEREAARADRAHRLEMGRRLAHALGLGDDEGRLLEVIAYSPDLGCRIAAGAMLVGALERLVDAVVA
jgi:hypothetical protein